MDLLMELRFITFPFFMYRFSISILNAHNTIQIQLKTCLSRARQKQILFRRLVSDLLANKVNLFFAFQEFLAQ